MQIYEQHDSTDLSQSKAYLFRWKTRTLGNLLMQTLRTRSPYQTEANNNNQHRYTTFPHDNKLSGTYILNNFSLRTAQVGRILTFLLHILQQQFLTSTALVKEFRLSNMFWWWRTGRVSDKSASSKYLWRHEWTACVWYTIKIPYSSSLLSMQYTSFPFSFFFHVYSISSPSFSSLNIKLSLSHSSPFSSSLLSLSHFYR